MRRGCLGIAIIILVLLSIMGAAGLKAIAEKQLYLNIWAETVDDLYGYEIHIPRIEGIDKNAKITGAMANHDNTYEIIDRIDNNGIHYAVTLLGDQPGIDGKVLLFSVPVDKKISLDNIRPDIKLADSEGRLIALESANIKINTAMSNISRQKLLLVALLQPCCNRNKKI